MDANSYRIDGMTCDGCARAVERAGFGYGGRA